MQYSDDILFLISVINRKIKDADLIFQRCSAIGYTTGKNLYIVVVQVRREIESRVELLFLQHKLENVLDCKYSVLMHDQVVLLYDTDADFLQSRIHFMKNVEELWEHEIIMGVSSGFDKIGDFADHYQQAQKTIQLANCLQLEGNLFYYDDLVLYHLLEDYAEWKSIDIFIHPAIKILMRASEKGTDYLGTLKVFLDCNQDMLDASRVMFMHYNTMKYRISKIIDKTGLDLKNPDEVLRVQLSFKILKMREINSGLHKTQKEKGE